MKCKPNIVLVTIDCLRADHMSCYGYKRKTTPFIDKLAENGALFPTTFTNGSFTILSIPSLFTSRLPFLWNKNVSMVELLKRTSYRTFAFNPNPLLITVKGLRIKNGFDKYEAFLEKPAQRLSTWGNITKLMSQLLPRKSRLYKILLPLITFFPLGIKAKCAEGDEINKEVFKWLKEIKQPFFMWIHYMDAHQPTLPPDRHIEALGMKNFSEMEKAMINRKIFHFPEKLTRKEVKKRIDLYDASIRFVDEMVKELTEKLMEENLYQNTILIITSDHGEEFGEHGSFLHDEGHMYEEIMHIPLIIVNYENIDVKRIVSLLDLAPTIAEITGIKTVNIFEGNSILSKAKNNFVLGVGCKHRKEYINTGYENVPKTIVCRTKKYKLIYHEDMKNYEFYNLTDDPTEENNIYRNEKESEIVRWMKKNISNYIAEINKRRKIKDLAKKLRG